MHAKTLVILARADQLDDLQAAARLVGKRGGTWSCSDGSPACWRGRRSAIDARNQFAILGRLDEDALRALASGDVIEGESVEEHELVA